MTALTVRQPCDLPNCPYCPECGLGAHTTFAERVALWLDEESYIALGLHYESVVLVDQLIKKYGSLRAVARETGLSPTYLSIIHTGKATLSAARYMKLTEFIEP